MVLGDPEGGRAYVKFPARLPLTMGSVIVIDAPGANDCTSTVRFDRLGPAQLNITMMRSQSLPLNVGSSMLVFWASRVRIIRAVSCVAFSRSWPAKNNIAPSRIANSTQKNNGATSAKSTAAEPRRLRRNRSSAFLVTTVATAGDDIERPQDGSDDPRLARTSRK